MLWKFAGLCALVMAAMWSLPAGAQTSEMKEKPAMYTYVSFWTLPRAQWGEMAKEDEADKAVLDKAMAAGTIMAYGNDMNLVHSADGPTHDEWWSSTSMAGLLTVLNQFYSSGSAASPVLQTATKHFDGIYVSRYYNYHPGSWKGAYTHGSTYKLKADAPDDAVAMVAKNLFAPFFEKLLANGTIQEYEIDTQAIHTENPDMFFVFYIAGSADSIDKVNASLRETMKGNPLALAAFQSMVDFSVHRDDLDLTNATYK
jgi:hypothetical protein